ncbi:MAG: protease pro-enzyme activation domain-containing protein [Terracidiphilus sp.]
MIQKLGKFVLPVIAVLGIAATDCQAQSVSTRHVRDTVRNGQAPATGRLPSNQILQLDLVLRLSDQAGLDSFLKDLYDPASPSYRHFLTPEEFTSRFGPSQSDYDTLVRFARTYGFEVVGGTRDSMDVQVKGSVANIEAAFHLNMRTYQHPTENRAFFGPDSEPTLDLPFNLWHISGLDNYSTPHAMLEDKDVYAQAHGIDASNVVSHATTGSGPSASFLGTDMRAAYYGGALTGAGQKVGLFEYYGTDLADLTTYYTNVHQTNTVPVTLKSTDGTSTACLKKSGCDDTEQTLDMTQALGMAPGLSSLVMYVGSTDTAIIGAMTTDSPLPGTIGCSWGWTPVDPTSLEPYFKKMAAQGQNFFVASGDSSTWKASTYPWPAEDPYVVTVGGTDLVTASAGGAWNSETAWVDSGGGISPDHLAIPAWQQLAGVINSTNKGSTAYRNGPDVSANANFSFYVCADQTTCTANSYGGTSFAAPMWAAYIALVNQQLAASSLPAIGFINPTIYAQNVSGGALSAAYTSDFHDITSGTSGSYSAATGYDLVTGWGSPNTGLFGALTGSVPTSGFTLSATAVSIVQGTSGASTVTSTPFSGYTPTITLSVSGLPSGVTVQYGANPFGPSGSTTITFVASAAAATGITNVTVTGKGGDGTIQTTTVSLTVTAAPSSFTIGASPTSLSIARGSSGTTKITTTVTQGSIASISLSASGQGRGTTISFSPSSIAGSGTSTLKATVSRTATTGTFSIVVKGTGGGNSHTVTIPLTVH